MVERVESPVSREAKGWSAPTVALMLCLFILLPPLNRLSKGGMIRKERIKKENLEARDSNGGPGG